jgi:hypothetical protein
VRPAVRHKSAPADRIFIKLNIEKFYGILNSDFGFGWTRIQITDSPCKDLNCMQFREYPCRTHTAQLSNVKTQLKIQTPTQSTDVKHKINI